jgi:hypothetical protein
MKGVCQLCAEEKVLVKAHVIPESFYKELYDESHSYDQVLENDKEFRKSRKRKGLYDTKILCKSCDESLGSKYDDYGSKAFWGYHNLGLDIKDFFDRSDPRVRWREAINVDSNKIKLFLLSILWRASVSKLDFFKDVSLGEKHELEIRKMILKGEGKDINSYPILLMHCAINDATTRRFLSTIVRFRKDGRTHYAALLCGVMVIWYVSAVPPSGLEEFIIDPANRKIKIVFSTNQGWDAVRKFVGEKALGRTKLL